MTLRISIDGPNETGFIHELKLVEGTRITFGDSGMDEHPYNFHVSRPAQPGFSLDFGPQDVVKISIKP